MSPRARRCSNLLCLCLGLAGAWLVPRPASARASGITATGCEGCHSSNDPVTLSLTPNAAEFSPGQEVVFTLAVAAANERSAGVYVMTESVGQFRPLSGQSLAVVGSGMTHTSPRTATSGAAQFQFAWKAPDTPGAVGFAVYAVAANADGSNRGDTSGNRVFEWVYGCEGQTFYLDADGDGYGRDSELPRLGCQGSPPANYVSLPGDCRDFNERVHPGAEEYCNLLDDDCDGEIDENALPVTLWPDADGDGFYSRPEGESIIGCAGTKGYAAFPGDCSPLDPNTNPGAEEVCNLRDDDCDGDVDEQVRPTCGEGWCRRASSSCGLDDCVPGQPRVEECNAFDDDCDGDIDNGDLCPPSQLCSNGRCIPLGLAESPGTPGEASGHTATATPTGCAFRRSGERAPLAVFMATLAAALVRRRRLAPRK